MARVRKPQPTLDNLYFSTPEQKIMRFLLSEPTSSFTPRVISSKLKGVRGLGGADGIMRILRDLESIGLVDFVDNQRAIRLRDEAPSVRIMKTFLAMCELEGLRQQLEPISAKGVLYGSRARGEARTDSDYDLFVVTSVPEEVKKIGERHPLGKRLELVAYPPDAYAELEKKEPGYFALLARGIVLWGSSW